MINFIIILTLLKYKKQQTTILIVY